MEILHESVLYIEWKCPTLDNLGKGHEFII